MILARPFCSIDLCDLVFYQCVFVFCLITAALLALCFSHSVTGRGEKNLCNVHVLSHSYWRHTWIDRKGSGTTAMCGTDVLMIGSMKQRGWMRSAVEMEMVEMVQQGREGFDTFLKRASRISLTWDCILMEGVKLLGWDFSLWIPFFPSVPIPPFSFLFFIFPISALAELQNLIFFNGLLTLQTASQHSGARITPPPHLCVHQLHLAPQNTWIPFAKTSQERPRPHVTAFLFCVWPLPCGLQSYLLPWLYFFICFV